MSRPGDEFFAPAGADATGAPMTYPAPMYGGLVADPFASPPAAPAPAAVPLPRAPEPDAGGQVPPAAFDPSAPTVPDAGGVPGIPAPALPRLPGVVRQVPRPGQATAAGVLLLVQAGFACSGAALLVWAQLTVEGMNRRMAGVPGFVVLPVAASAPRALLYLAVAAVAVATAVGLLRRQLLSWWSAAAVEVLLTGGWLTASATGSATLGTGVVAGLAAVALVCLVTAPVRRWLER